MVGALEIVVGGHVAASLGFMTVLALSLLVDATLFLFSVALFFLTLGLVSG